MTTKPKRDRRYRVRAGHTLVPVWLRNVDTTLRRFAERIPAGFPSAAEGYEDDPLNLQEFVVRHPAATFYFRVSGDGLIDEHIRDGSLLVIDRTINALPGRLVVIEHEGHFVITRMPTRCDGMVLVFGVVIAALTRF